MATKSKDAKNYVEHNGVLTKDIQQKLSVPVARDEMDEASFHAMMERGLNEAKADKSRTTSDVFADLERKIQ